MTALNLAHLTGATLVIPKLDRLSRNAAFLLTLRDSGSRFLACDMPEANDLTVGTMALVAQQEREAISRRTKEALATARARGVKLGNPNGAAALRRAGTGCAALGNAVQTNANAFAAELAPVLAGIARRGSGQLKLLPEAPDRLKALRDRLGKPLIVRSACRSPEHNRNVGGAPPSKHMAGMAFDIAISNHDLVDFEAVARAVGFLGFGFYPRSGFLHIDLGPARVRGEPFPQRAIPFAPEAQPARETLATAARCAAPARPVLQPSVLPGSRA